MKTPRDKDTRIPRRPFLWLAAALLFTLPPMFGTLSSWVPGIFLIALAAKFWMEPRGYRLRSPVWKLLIGAVALVCIFISYGSIKGIEPGVSLIAVLMSLKILEAHTAREFQVMVMVAWLLCLCGFFLSQDLSIALCLLLAFTLLLVALIQFHRGSSDAFWPPVCTACKLLAQALPLIAALFLFFPRVATGFRFQIVQSRLSATGFGDRLAPGSVSSLANSTSVAFRAEFPDGRIPSPAAMYWRGVVMRQCNGLEWRASEEPASIPRSSQHMPEGEGIRQWITLEPYGGHWMFALDWPATPAPGTTLAPGNCLWSGQPIRKPKRYEVTSFPEIRAKELHPRERKLLLEVPATISPAVWQLVQSWKATDPSPRAVVHTALQFFRTQRFRYSLAPGEYQNNGLDEFLFHRRLGFCEHYAAAFATLMRVAGIPARVVVGYLGGEYNELGRFFLVRQADTHAWCEVWLDNSGWARIDPTSVVAPDRVNLGLNLFLERRAASGQAQLGQSTLVRTLSHSKIFAEARLAWQTLNYAWDTRVLSFDGETQESFLSEIGIRNSGPLPLIGWSSAIAAGVIGIYVGWMVLFTRAGGDRVKTLYKQFCRKAARLGAHRELSEGPSDFANRAARLLPNESHRIRRISNAYITIRYSTAATAGLVQQFAKEVNAFGSTRL
jgi:transglutaminase-like putative cysteine protease